MKTIEEAAKESYRMATDPETGGECHFHYTDEMIFKNGFKAGVEFAQRWYSVDEESPTNREVVLAKVPFINYPLLFSYNEITNKWYQFDEGDFYESEINPTHWRPIELK